ncbi:MAG TPA: MBL fold metallo-hydrolase [Flavobacteriaceae bacterium]|nr:MBL fold metallo-hydrolase [Flavobacteriaceae bacterium]
MHFELIYDKSLAHASYFIGCQKVGVAAIIDPKRDVDVYIEMAKKNNMKITHVLETHIHADFLAGSREISKLTGAKMYVSDEGGEGWEYEITGFPLVKLKHKDEFMVGNLKFEVIHTPGHTPESISFLLTDTPASPEPVMYFTGDFVFVGDIGRPDLLEKAAGIMGTADAGAIQMYDSIKSFNELPNHIQVWPAHGAGSACGKALGSVPSSTVGYEKLRNWAFQYGDDKQGFIDYLLLDQPEPPKYFAMMKSLNKIDRRVITEVPKLKSLSSSEFNESFSKGVKLFDAREKQDFAKGFIPGSINAPASDNFFATKISLYVNYNEDIMLLADESQLDELTRKLMRIGLDNVKGFISSTDAYDGELEKVNFVSMEEMESLKNQGTLVVDLRGVSEYKEGHVEGAKNVYFGTIEDNLDQIPKDKKVIVHCQSGHRASIAYSVLVKNGYTNILNFSGGMNEWLKKDKPVVLGK